MVTIDINCSFTPLFSEEARGFEANPRPTKHQKKDEDSSANVNLIGVGTLSECEAQLKQSVHEIICRKHEYKIKYLEYNLNKTESQLSVLKNMHRSMLEMRTKQRELKGKIQKLKSEKHKEIHQKFIQYTADAPSSRILKNDFNLKDELVHLFPRGQFKLLPQPPAQVFEQTVNKGCKRKSPCSTPPQQLSPFYLMTDKDQSLNNSPDDMTSRDENTYPSNSSPLSVASDASAASSNQRIPSPLDILAEASSKKKSLKVISVTRAEEQYMTRIAKIAAKQEVQTPMHTPPSIEALKNSRGYKGSIFEQIVEMRTEADFEAIKQRLPSQDINFNMEGWSVLFLTVFLGNRKLLDEIFKCQPNCFLLVNGWSLMALAGYVGNIAVIEYLLAKGIGTDCQFTPFGIAHVLTHYQKAETLEILCKKTKVDLDESDMFGMTPMFYAIQLMPKELKKEKKNYSQQFYKKTNMFNCLLKLGASLSARGYGGFTPVMFAAEKGILTAVRMILDKNRNLTNHRDIYGRDVAFYIDHGNSTCRTDKNYLFFKYYEEVPQVILVK